MRSVEKRMSMTLMSSKQSFQTRMKTEQKVRTRTSLVKHCLSKPSAAWTYGLNHRNVKWRDCRLWAGLRSLPDSIHHSATTWHLQPPMCSLLPLCFATINMDTAHSQKLGSSSKPLEKQRHYNSNVITVWTILSERDNYACFQVFTILKILYIIYIYYVCEDSLSSSCVHLY